MFKEFADKFLRLSTLNKLIAANILVFVLFFVANTFIFLFQLPENKGFSWLALSSHPKDLLYKPWTLVSYCFIHSGLFHLLFNMILLYFSGKFFTAYLTGKQLLNFYFLGTIAGAVVYILSYNLFPVFAKEGTTHLVGASAAVMAVLVGIATYIPYMGVRLLLLGRVKLWHIALFFVLLDIVLIPVGNAGGRFAHLGGALLGFVYAKQLLRGNDTRWRNWITRFAGVFSFKKQKKLRTVYRKKKRNNYVKKETSKTEKQKKIDHILDKISKSGYESLSKEEKEVLFKAGKE